MDEGGGAPAEGNPGPGGAARARADRRLDRLLDAEGAERSRLTVWAVTVALIAMAPVVALAAGWPGALYYFGLMALFIAAVWAQRLAAGRRGRTNWRAFALTAFNFALLSFALNARNPIAEFEMPPGMMVHFGEFAYFFIVLAALAFSFSPALVLWGGVCGAAAWLAGRFWVSWSAGLSTDLGLASPQTQAEYDRALAAALDPGYADPDVWIQQAAVFLAVAAMLAEVVRGSRRLLERQARLERRGANLARYLPGEMAERMAESDEAFVEDRRLPAAVMFTDVVGFTGWAEGRDPQEVVLMLREVHALVAEEAFRARGVLDKFIGDGAMVTFGVAPLAGETQPPDPAELARRAFACADAILARVAEWNAGRVAQGKDPVRVSIGLHLGEVVVGDVGSPGRMELAAVGDTVNVASRLEALSRPLHCAAVASAEIVEAAGGVSAPWGFRGVQALPGRRGAETVWVRGRAEGDPAGP
jgi:adenylate cyclase